MVETVLRLGLGLVLAWAALAKLVAPSRSMAALESFGFEGGPLRPFAWASLIAVEICLGVAVAVGSDTAAYAAAALMLLYAAITVSALLRGRAGAPCACFGARSRISWLGALRNLALAAAFALAPNIDSLSAGAWLGIGVGVALVACACLAVAVLALAREVGMLRLQLGTQGALEITGEGPEVGTRADELAARLRRPDADAQRDLGLAVFTSEGCRLCQTLSPAIENVAKDPHVTVGLFDEETESGLWKSLRIPGSPFAIALDPAGVVLAKGTFNSLPQLESVLATAERRRRDGTAQPPEDSDDERLGRLPIGA